jgi:hypothetical protein
LKVAQVCTGGGCLQRFFHIKGLVVCIHIWLSGYMLYHGLEGSLPLIWERTGIKDPCVALCVCDDSAAAICYAVNSQKSNEYRKFVAMLI